MEYTYRPSGVCARNIRFSIENGFIKNVEFTGGCNGNAQGLSRLVEDMPADEAIRRLEGIRCGNKSTSCPDQLALAIRKALA